MAELEVEQGIIELELENPGAFLGVPKEKQANLYKLFLDTALEVKCVELATNQTLDDLLKRNTPNDAKAEIANSFNKLVSGTNQKINIYATKALNVLACGYMEVNNFARKLNFFAGVKKGIKRVKAIDDKITKAYPTAWPMAKGFVISGAIATLTGGTGIAAYGAWRLGKTIKKQREAALKKQMGYWDYLKSDKTQMFTLAGAVVTTAISCAGISMENLGLAGEAINGNLGERFASMFSNADSAADGAVTLADRGRAFWNAIANNFSNTTYLARTGAATATSVAIASAEFAKLGNMEPGSKEYLAQKKAAWRMLRGSAYGTLLGMTAGGLMGAANAEHHVESSTPSTDPVTTHNDIVDNSHLGPVGDGKTSNPWDWRNWTGINEEAFATDVPSDNVESAGGENVADNTLSDNAEGHETQVDTTQVEKVYSDGLKSTTWTDEKGMRWIRLEGEGSVETSDAVQAKYEARLNNLNEHNEITNWVSKETGEPMDMTRVLEIMKGNWDSWNAAAADGLLPPIPEGLTFEHAAHTAIMDKIYTGDSRFLSLLTCGNFGENPAELAVESCKQFSTNIAHVGRLIGTDLPYSSRPVNVAVCEPYVEENPVVVPEVVPTFGEPDYDYPKYSPETVTTTTTTPDKYYVSYPHGLHPIPEDATITMTPEGKNALITYSEESGLPPKEIPVSVLRKEAGTSISTTTEVPYEPYSAEEVAAAAQKAGCEPGKLTHTSTLNNVRNFKMYTEDGVVRISVGEDNIPHYEMNTFDGKEATTVPTDTIRGHFAKADASLRANQYESIPAKTHVNQVILNGKGNAR
ncbi:MAG: hypothetical protein IKA03_00500 [Alphaproteobacteria bacterium]|nr:hypothetical protein [Alphaproteobacteria bacterium]